MRIALLPAALLLAGTAFAQTATQGTGAPPAGSGGGGPVNESVPAPRAPQGVIPPGTPSSQTARDAVGTAMLGKTETPPSPVPGNTGGADSGVRK